MPHDLRPATAGVPVTSVTIADQASQSAETIRSHPPTGDQFAQHIIQLARQHPAPLQQVGGKHRSPLPENLHDFLSLRTESFNRRLRRRGQ